MQDNWRNTDRFYWPDFFSSTTLKLWSLRSLWFLKLCNFSNQFSFPLEVKRFGLHSIYCIANCNYINGLWIGIHQQE